MSIRRLAVPCLLSFCCLSAGLLAQDPEGSKQEQEPGRVSGTQVRLDPPEGYEPTDQFAGYMHEDTGSSIMVSEVPGPYSEVSKSFSDREALARQGMTVVETTTRAQGEHPGMLLRIDQKAQEMSLVKWIWMFGSEEKSALVMGTCIADFADVQSPLLKKAVLSTKWDLATEVDPMEGIGFELGDTGGMKLMARLGNDLTFTADGKADKSNQGKPTMTIGRAIADVQVDDPEAFAVERAKKLPFRKLKIETSEAVEIDGLRGWSVVASAEQEGRAMVVRQVLLCSDDTYWLSVAAADAEQREEHLARFDRMIRSFRRVDAEADGESAENSEGSESGDGVERSDVNESAREDAAEEEAK